MTVHQGILVEKKKTQHELFIIIGWSVYRKIRRKKSAAVRIPCDSIPMNNLPPETVGKVLSFLPPPDLLLCTLVRMACFLTQPASLSRSEAEPHSFFLYQVCRTWLAEADRVLRNGFVVEVPHMAKEGTENFIIPIRPTTPQISVPKALHIPPQINVC